MKPKKHERMVILVFLVAIATVIPITQLKLMDLVMVQVLVAFGVVTSVEISSREGRRMICDGMIHHKTLKGGIANVSELQPS